MQGGPSEVLRDPQSEWVRRRCGAQVSLAARRRPPPRRHTKACAACLVRRADDARHPIVCVAPQRGNEAEVKELALAGEGRVDLRMMHPS